MCLILKPISKLHAKYVRKQIMTPKIASSVTKLIIVNTTIQVHKVSFLTCVSKINNATVEYVVDSGSSSHMVNDETLLSNICKSETNISVAKQNTSISSTGIGCVVNGECILNNVLYVPELSKNLLSVNSITENAGEVLFTKDKVVISKNKEIILEGSKNKNGLYVVKLKSDKMEKSMLCSTEDDIYGWHRKLGHLGV